ncbi:phage tail protein [Teredinibacter sp. KSP-S5-2]|uniref:phage tail protein n=1 Tax=Teredinibacter sp. KSP-S5-2 TaxID=3034506 RepID=UPI002934A7AB|nr:phage tail protein [Teredinibacter sp. KSP-S5-2]WNO10562.1 phage tail protein [Teredinibacter sp. KSP-S5-2]
MMALGPNYRFSIQTAAYQQLKITRSFQWVSQERISERPANQFISLGEKSLSLSGVIYPHYRGGLKQIDELEKEAEQGVPLQLVDGLGDVWGLWVVLSLADTRSFFLQNGQPQKQEFELSLRFYGWQIENRPRN